ncbi:hypothetical protein, partial [Pseudoalteromonas distincta]|uniref:hypothetical protein n=1 Tax=Pseudoalteromonas distincta TaxID=77608 RepID=UPI001C99896B
VDAQLVGVTGTKPVKSNFFTKRLRDTVLLEVVKRLSLSIKHDLCFLIYSSFTSLCAIDLLVVLLAKKLNKQKRCFSHKQALRLQPKFNTVNKISLCFSFTPLSLLFVQ